MKRVFFAAILGISLNITPSRGQGYILMESYRLNGPVGNQTPVYAGVTLFPGGPYVGAADGFKADLLFSLDGGETYMLAAGSETSFYVNGGVPSQTGGSPTTDGAGVFSLPTPVTIPGYTSGSVSFIVRAFNGPSYSQSIAGYYAGQSAPFTIASLNTNSHAPSADLLNGSGALSFTGTTSTGLQPFVLVIPEPSIFALAGLGAAGLMAFRRQK